MEKSDILKIFLEHGFQLDSYSLKFFLENKHEVEPFLTKIKKLDKPPHTITQDVIEKLLLKTTPPFTIIREFKQNKITITPQNYVTLFNKRYDTIKKFLANRLELINTISINKITTKTKKFSLIVLIRNIEREDKVVSVEDHTGSLEVHFSKNTDLGYLVEDEVVGLICERVEDRILVNSVIWPDVPVKKEVTKTQDDVYCLFVSDFHLEKVKQDRYAKFLEWLNEQNLQKLYIFILGGISDDPNIVKKFLEELPEKPTKIFLDDKYQQEGVYTINAPTILQIQNVMLFLAYREPFEKYQGIWHTTPENTILNLIKKRHLNPIFDPEKTTKNDPYMLDVIPDIFVVGGLGKPGSLNYKGITIFSNGSFATEPVFWLVNLRTRENIKVSFA
jgi:DNA polymerase II small subunit/DNA polymerase delta subunit B